MSLNLSALLERPRMPASLSWQDPVALMLASTGEGSWVCASSRVVSCPVE